MKTVWRVFAYLKRYPWLAAGTLSCAALSTLMVIVFPAATKWIIDDVVRANRPDKLLPLIALAGAAFLVQHVFNSLRIILNNTFEQKVAQNAYSPRPAAVDHGFNASRTVLMSSGLLEATRQVTFGSLATDSPAAMRSAALDFVTLTVLIFSPRQLVQL